MYILGLTLSTIGKIMLGLAILMVHKKMEKEHKIDKKVIRAMHKEKRITYIAIALILIGYACEMFAYHG